MNVDGGGGREVWRGRETGEGGGRWSTKAMSCQIQDDDCADDDAGDGGAGEVAGAALGGPEVGVWG